MAKKPKTSSPKTDDVAVSTEAQDGLVFEAWFKEWACVSNTYGVAAEMVFDYAEKVLTPRRLAEERRRAGDPRASISDYACGCPLSVADGLPRCFAHRETCRFRDRFEAPPRWGNDPIRHRTAKEEYAKLLERLRSQDEAAARLFQKIMCWYEREILVKRRGANRVPGWRPLFPK